MSEMSDDPILDQIPEVISRLDTERAIRGQNHASLERFGPSRGEPCYRAHFQRDSPCHGCLFDEVVSSGRTRRWYLAHEEGDTPQYFEITAAPVLDADGRVTEVVEIVRDHTMSMAVEQHLIRTSEELEEQAVRRAKEVEDLESRSESLRGELQSLRQEQAQLVQTEKMASLGRLAAGLTHEIHTPMGALVSNLDMQRRCLVALRAAEGDGVDGPLDTLDELLDLQRLATERIDKIVSSLRRFAHLDRAEVEPYDVHEGIDAALALLGHRTRGRIEVERDFGELPAILCRPDALNQVFMNLLENAVAAIEGPGSIRIQTRRLGDDRVELRFTDSGHGIDAQTLEKIFDPGFTTKPRGVGTGLGLAIALGTLRAHGGSVDVDSEPGRGSTFTLVLPLAGAEA